MILSETSVPLQIFARLLLNPNLTFTTREIAETYGVDPKNVHTKMASGVNNWIFSYTKGHGGTKSPSIYGAGEVIHKLRAIGENT